MRWLRELWLAMLLGWAAPAIAQERFDFDRTPGALSKQVVPTHYHLAFELDPALPAFNAVATIALRVRQVVDAVELHAHGLTAKSAELVGADGVRRTLSVSAGRAPQTWRLKTKASGRVEPGDYRLRIAYRGRVQPSGKGLFVVDYHDDGRPARLLATQLEAINAREVFPGFDEPAFRAPFEISVTAPAAYEVASNMPPLGPAEAVGAQRVHRFAPTPPMPSYLVALTVGRFDVLASQTAGVPLRVLTAPGKRASASYALAVTEKVMPYYHEFFGVPYALPKLDQLAVAGVRRGAMEDWGLISYSEPMLLFDPARSSPRTQRRVFNTVAHEVAHQWFGNLVTPASWEEIWLNEAFATWLAAKAEDHFNPDWNAPLHARRWIDEAMADDATLATRAIRSGPVRESSVADVFDSITYDKGGSVLEMLEQWLGAEVFRRGLAAYMQGQRLSNATAADLWHYMGEASGRDVRAVAASWTDQRGFPLVGVGAACREGRTRVTLTQQRFLVLGAAPAATLWKIPIQLQKGAQRRTVLLDAAEQSLDLDGCESAPLVANAGGKGFYRVAYEGESRRALAQGFAGLAAADQAALLSDSFALAQAGRQPMAAYFELLDHLGDVNAAARGPLYAMAAESIALLDTALHGTPAQARLRAAARGWFAPALARLGWQPVAGEDDESAQLRATLIESLGAVDDPQVVRQALADFDAEAAGGAALPASTRAAIITAVGTHADARRFEQLLGRLRSATREEDRELYAEALARGRDARRAQRLLAEALAGRLAPNIGSALPGLVAEQPAHTAMAYAFVLRHWPRLAKMGGGVFGEQAGLLPHAAAGFTDVDRARRLIADQRARAGPDGDAAAAKAARRIELLAKIRRAEAAALAAALVSRTSGT